MPDGVTLDDRCARAGEQPGEDAVADLLQHEMDCVVRGHLRRVRLGESDRDEEQRHADSVVQAALDVKPLADQGGEPFVGDDRLAERRVGARQADAEDQCLRPAQVRQHTDGDERAGHDRQRQAHAEEAEWEGVLHAERAQVDPRRVGEQNERERRLREELDLPAARGKVDETEPRAYDQAREREENRRSDECALEPGRAGRVRQHEERDRRDRPVVHRRHPRLSARSRLPS